MDEAIIDERPSVLRWEPTLGEIAEACRQIQASWTDAERERRTVFKPSAEVWYGRPVRVMTDD